MSDELIVGLDIDGTLGMYHRHLHQFAMQWTGKVLPPWPLYTGGSLAAYWGLSDDVYRVMKHAYRMGGQKRSMPVYDGASAFTHGLANRGVHVVLCTARPAQLGSVVSDTEEWARRNRIFYDRMIFGESKYEDLLLVAGRTGRVLGVVDDLPEMYAQAEALNLNPILVERPYNIGHPATRVQTLRQAHLLLNHRIDKEHRRG